MLWENVEVYYGEIDPQTHLAGRSSNMACHDMCIKYEAPEGIAHLLGLGAKYCVKPMMLSMKTTGKMMESVRRNVRWRYIFHDSPDNSDCKLHTRIIIL